MALTFLGLCLTPAWLRLRNPTFFHDDVVRIVQLQTQPLKSVLFVPFNEHMAPFFNIVTWTTWELADRRISAAPIALFLASCVPFAATLGLLGLVIRRELGSTSTALAAVAVFGLASHDSEVLYWYSASSFTWASAATLLAWLGASRAANARTRRGIAGWLAVSALGSFSGPSFSAIGLLAGPLAALRLVFDPSAPRRLRWLGAVVPMVGVLAYLVVCESFRYRAVLADGLGRHVELSTVLWNIGRAPVDILLPGLLGVRNIDSILPDALELSLSLLLALGLLVWAWRSPGRRPLILGGLGLIAGGYAVTYGVRTVPDARLLINFQRYHLFPQMGLTMLIAPALGLAYRRLDGRPLAMLAAANALALAMAWAHLPQMKEHLRYSRFPDQPATLAALDRLEESCRLQGISRDQALAALDPIRPTWVPWDGNGIELLPASLTASRPSVPVLKRALLAELSAADREALCGGMDASAYRVATPALAGSRAPTLARLVSQSRVRPTGHDRYESAGWPAFLEYQIDPEADDARALALSDVRATHNVELVWADAEGPWSPNRSAWWKPAADQDWAVPLDRLPHWQAGHVRRLRVYFHEPGIVTLGAPRLLR